MDGILPDAVGVVPSILRRGGPGSSSQLMAGSRSCERLADRCTLRLSMTARAAGHAATGPRPLRRPRLRLQDGSCWPGYDDCAAEPFKIGDIGRLHPAVKSSSDLTP